MKLKDITLVALFAAMTVASGLIRIPIIPVPFTLQTLMVYLSGDLLGSKKGALSQILFLLLGLAGLPIFSMGGGPGYVFQPTFGYLLSFPFAAWLIGVLHEKKGIRICYKNRLLYNCLGMLVIHTIGVLYLYFTMNYFLGKSISFSRAIVGGSLIFLPAEFFKVVISAGISERSKLISHSVQAGILGLLILFSPDNVFAQRQSQLDKIRRDIQRLESELSTQQAKETSLLEQLENINREIGLRQNLLNELELERIKMEKAGRETETKLLLAGNGRQRQKDLVLRRMVSIYKRGRLSEWEILFSMNSLSQVLVWIKYQKRIMENDRRNLRLLQKKEIEVEIEKKAYEKQIDQKQRLIREIEAEKTKYESDNRSRKKLLTQVRREKEPILEQLRIKRQAFNKIEGWIAEEENRRKKEKKRVDLEKIPLPPINTILLKPIWPVKGRIVSRYGKQLDPQTRTWTENLGIDIEAQARSKIQAASTGQVKYVTWLRGMGNLVLLDHGGFYTVYGHLDAVYVNNSETIKQGSIIGEVGDHLSLYGSMLHFEIWKGTTHYDPEILLR